MHWQTTRFLLDLAQPRIMGIVNVTPDSFSDGGAHDDAASALRHCEQLLAQGADILDIGGESTRPGAPAVLLDEEQARVLPVLREAVKLGVPVSVDTYKPELMHMALDMGADIINDVWALQQPGAAAIVARHAQCGVCLMHMHRDPQTMQSAPMTGDAVAQVRSFLAQAAARLTALGVAPSRIVLDPGIGFGKTVPQNFSLLARQQELLALGYPILAGWSRKSSLGAALQALPPGVGEVAQCSGLLAHERSLASVAAALLAVEKGACIVRVHDVAATRQALAVWQAMRASEVAA